jgi:cytochrome o ubiquinol oxidase subunit 2
MQTLMVTFPKLRLHKKTKAFLVCLVAIAIVSAAIVFFSQVNVAVLNPKGEIADKQRSLMLFTLLLSAIVVVPVFALLGIIAWKYREGNTKAHYRPNWDSNRLLETIWWGIPCAIILVLGIVTWQSSHELDPYKALNSSVPPINVQVVALQWKWLFIYPDLRVASVNYLAIPEHTPINFTVTADAPMNSFWIPSLGGQVYAMSGMSTQLHLMADTTGDFKGSSANISGTGFAQMAFMTHASTQADFSSWVQKAQAASGLDMTVYTKLAQPSTTTPASYSLKDVWLYDKILMKYMAPMSTTQKSVTTDTSVASQAMNIPNTGGVK